MRKFLQVFLRRLDDGESAARRIKRAMARFDAAPGPQPRPCLRTMLEAASVDKPGRSAIDQKIGDYYAACMDEKGIDARGTAPLKPDLDRIAALKNKKDLAELVAMLSPRWNIGVLQFLLRAGRQGFDAGDRRHWIRAASGFPIATTISRPTRSRWNSEPHTWRMCRRCSSCWDRLPPTPPRRRRW